VTELAVICALQCAVILMVLWLWQKDREHVAKERVSLLDRIKAPEYTAVRMHNEGAEDEPLPRAVMPEDDADFWQSREDLADRLAAEEVNGAGNG